MGGRNMSKKITIFVIVSLIFTFLIYANGGDSVIYRKLEFTVPVGKVDPQTLPDDLIKYLSSYYSIEIMSKENRIIKYNWKKFLYYENKLLINKEKAYVKLHMNMQQQQPNLFYRKKIMIGILILFLHVFITMMILKKILFFFMMN